MKQFTIFSKKKLLIALDINETTYNEEKEQLLKNDFEILIKNIQAKDKEIAIEKAKYEEAKQFNNDNIVSSFFDVL
ncbi:hypothetical protein L4D04_21855 [Photobacterium angustum]|uniref:Uncharacterized protein n=1 Tax=Photobacterium leiognathi lrivu.4.1 TaxID=1248232 RepID=V5F7T4_PHOLE|nr:hypothetical protein [Photobacterium leiognathi]GAD31394.1 hypothetical protein PLEI_3054 [Photobacterium leiognathi lrivu.4.1]